MENIVDSLESAYEEFVNATTNFLEASQASGGLDTAAHARALEQFTQQYQMFKDKCDNAEEFVAYAKHSIANECVTNEATFESGKEEFLVDDVEFKKDDDVMVPHSPIECLEEIPGTPLISPFDFTFEEDKAEKDTVEENDEAVKK